MKFLVFAHTPPPHHGQSYMVQLLLHGFSSEPGRTEDNFDTGYRKIRSEVNTLECYHINCRLSEGIEDIGSFRLMKMLVLLKYCAMAIWCRFRHRVTNFYYVPAPGMRSAVYRDWIVMLLCRPFFKNVVFHWHATGLGEWLENKAHPLERFITKNLLGQHRMSIVLGNIYISEVEKFSPFQIEVIPNGIPDPCPDFELSLLPRRLARVRARRKLLYGQNLSSEDLQLTGEHPEIFRVVYLGLCVREKGLFDAVEGVALVNRSLADRGCPVRVHLTVAGKFWREEEQEEFHDRISQPDLNHCDGHSKWSAVEYRGFVSGEEKKIILQESDCFCFPTYYGSEGHPVSILEAMAYGLPSVVTRWRMLPELFPDLYVGLVEPRAPAQVATALNRLLEEGKNQFFREHFLSNFTEVSFAVRIKTALGKLY